MPRADLFVVDLRMQLNPLLQNLAKEQRTTMSLIEEDIHLRSEKIVELRRERRGEWREGISLP